MAEKINRRDFLKMLGATGLAGGAAAISGCKNVSSTEGNGEMTCRVNPGTGDKVSLLGYGMMRLPLTGESSDAHMHSHEAFQLRSRDLESRGFHRDVREFA